MAPSTAKIANDDSTRREQHHAPARVREHAPLALPSPLSPSVAPPSSSSFSAPCAGVSAVCGTRTRVSVSSSAAAASSARRSTARSSSASRVVGPSVASPPSGKPDTLSLIFVSDAKKKSSKQTKNTQKQEENTSKEKARESATSQLFGHEIGSQRAQYGCATATAGGRGTPGAGAVLVPNGTRGGTDDRPKGTRDGGVKPMPGGGCCGCCCGPAGPRCICGSDHLGLCHTQKGRLLSWVVIAFVCVHSDVD